MLLESLGKHFKYSERGGSGRGGGGGRWFWPSPVLHLNRKSDFRCLHSLLSHRLTHLRATTDLTLGVNRQWQVAQQYGTVLGILLKT